MKRQPRLTKKEKKATSGPAPIARGDDHHHHIHCTACGKHLDAEDFDPPASAVWAKCEHGSQFPSCSACLEKTKALLAEHDRTGEPVRSAAAYH